MTETQEILKAIDRVRPFPGVVLKALALLENPEVPAIELVEVIQYDPAITMRVLKICNSATFGLRRNVESLQQALVVLGNQRMMRILVTSGALDFLDGEMQGYGLEYGELWQHSVSCALISQILLRFAQRPEEDHALFTGALLHDVGKIVLNEYAGKTYQEILQRVWSLNRSSLEAERDVLGIDHAKVGALLAEKWGFPTTIVSIIGRHHDPVDPAKDQLPLCLVHLANLLCLQMGIGAGDRGLASRSAPEVIRALGWTSRDLDALISDFSFELEKVKDLLELARSREQDV